MSLHHWLIYLSVVLAVIVAPGPSAILCVSHGVAHGAKRTVSTIVGGHERLPHADDAVGHGPR